MAFWGEDISSPHSTVQGVSLPPPPPATIYSCFLTCGYHSLQDYCKVLNFEQVLKSDHSFENTI